VNDRSTADLMKEFYRRLLTFSDRPFGPARALREAQAWLRRRTDETGEPIYAEPWYWATFIAMGV